MRFPGLAICAAFSALPGVLFGAPKEIVVCHFNVRNYVDAQPASESQRFPTKAKPEEEIAALLAIIKEINPDVLGICEMGSPARFEDFKKRLAQAGLGYVDSEYLQAADADRHLALLSRFPIVVRNSQADVSFQINGRVEKVRRGFLDVTLQVNPDYQLRTVGVHLKSKLTAEAGEALLRRHEAQELRKHVDKIMAADPEVNLLCYGDFNDTKDTPMFQEISGPRGTATHLTDLAAEDVLGDRWTHHWKVADQYSRIDYLFASPLLVREVVKGKSTVYRGPLWDTASDHRAVYSSIIPANRK
ncbi:MAG TPA: endonuclease/exonuclease/phosphatase family protein [Chthoniobacteraceae bacterium]|jgi:endonuclease/exonuclease/phosphatase family metal-dependent hydrolase